MFSLRRILVVALTAATVVVADYNTVLADLRQTDITTKNLTTATNRYDGSGATVATLQNTFKRLLSELDKAKSDGSASAVPTAAQAQTVIAYVNGTLFTDTKATNDATIAKRAQFTANGLKTQVQSSQKQIKDAVDALADVLIAKAPTAQLKSQSQAIKARYDAVFTNTINAFT